MKKKYWIGDLCYVMHAEWNEFCSLTISGYEVTDGVFALADGRKFGFKGTFWGDGEYRDQHGNVYGVDAGLIGVIALDDIDKNNVRNDVSLGHIFEFEQFPDVSSTEGVISIGSVHIDTKGGEEDEEEEGEEDF